MKCKKLTFDSRAFPPLLKSIPNPPTILYIAGDCLHELWARPAVTIVGSRKMSTYGKAVTTELASTLAREGVVIVSGLAYGVDAVAHQAALDAGGLTIAVLPSSLDAIYPRGHYGLAMQILQQGGALITEYPNGAAGHRGAFVARNRIASGLSHVTLITEAAHKSGTLHTAEFALEQGREVMAVPGNITSPASAGTNNLIKSGAYPVTDATDVLHALGLRPATKKAAPKGDTAEQQVIIDLLARGEADGTTLHALSMLDIPTFNQNLTMLEITGRVRSLGNNKWALA